MLKKFVVVACIALLPAPVLSQGYSRDEGRGSSYDRDYDRKDDMKDRRETDRDDNRESSRGMPGGGYCDQLRRACENKDALGEVGQGNCRRFREECGRPRPPRRDICQELRQACLYKDEMGERGRGNCREYRETCR